MSSSRFISDANNSIKNNWILRKKGTPFQTLNENKIPKSFVKVFEKPTPEEFDDYRKEIYKKRKREQLINRILFLGILIGSYITINMYF